MPQFEWDAAKAEQNLAKHRIDFMDAIQVFEVDHLTYRSDRFDEERYVTVGMLGGVLAAVVWTPREADVRRIISVRRARHVERESYREGVLRQPQTRPHRLGGGRKSDR